MKGAIKKCFISLLTITTLGAGCVSSFYFRYTHPNSIKNVQPRITAYKKSDTHSYDLYKSFSQLTWQEAIKKVQTPQEARLYVAWLKARKIKRSKTESRSKLEDDGMHMYSFKKIHEGCPIDCTEAATAAAALLSDNGYPPLLLMIDGEPTGHATFLYKGKDKFDSIGIVRLGRNTWGPPQEPRYKNLNDLVKDLVKATDTKPIGYLIINLSENNPDWLTTDENMQKEFDSQFEIKD
ncbi:MAG: hypothetical protein ISS23_02505 [Nanoarchaeota archaeon]|nr:hypothetical protein [Nanoarchaeota archaeon]